MLLFSSKERDEAHKKLEAVLKDGKHPHAECREDFSQEKPFQVWDAPEKPPDWQDLRIRDPFPAQEPDISDALLDRLAAKLLEKMSEKK